MKKIIIKMLVTGIFLITLLCLNVIAYASSLTLTDTAAKKIGAANLSAQVTNVPVPVMAGCKVSQIINFSIDTITTPSNGKEIVKLLTENNQIVITISNPKDFLLSRPSDNSQLILYADGLPLTGMHTDYFSEVSRQYLNDPTKCWPDTMQIHFLFTRDTSSEEAWNNMFRLAKWNKNTLTFKMSLGWSGMFPLETNGKLIKIGNKDPDIVTVKFYNKGSFVIFSLLYGVFIFCFVLLCYYTGLIRDPDTINGTRGPFSLAQTQLAFWTVLIIGGFSYLWLLTRQADAVNNSILLLLGISGSTTGAASFIDYYKRSSLAKTQANLPLDAQAQPAPGNLIGDAPAIIPNTTKHHRNFILDIFSDGVNISIQRVQVTMWNLVLGLYFIWYVITNKSMPDFNNTLLVLAGVSSVLYIGSKGPENPQTIAQPAAKA